MAPATPNHDKATMIEANCSARGPGAWEHGRSGAGSFHGTLPGVAHAGL